MYSENKSFLYQGKMVHTIFIYFDKRGGCYLRVLHSVGVDQIMILVIRQPRLGIIYNETPTPGPSNFGPKKSRTNKVSEF